MRLKFFIFLFLLNSFGFANDVVRIGNQFAYSDNLFPYTGELNLKIENGQPNIKQPILANAIMTPIITSENLLIEIKIKSNYPNTFFAAEELHFSSSGLNIDDSRLGNGGILDPDSKFKFVEEEHNKLYMHYLHNITYEFVNFSGYKKFDRNHTFRCKLYLFFSFKDGALFYGKREDLNSYDDIHHDFNPECSFSVTKNQIEQWAILAHNK